MLRLATLGGIMLTRDGASLPWIQRGWQRGALFALLAAAGRRGLDRELLASLLWPDSLDSAARHSLDELLSRARRELDCKELFGAGASVALNVDVITIDLHAFEDAISNSHFERAVQLYQGPFADGLRLASADEVERRIAATRTRVADAHASALESLARRAAERADLPSAARWWLQLAQGDPLSPRIAKAYLTALIAAGESARALAHARVHQTLVREELGIAPDPEIVEIERRLRTADASPHDSAHSQSSPRVSSAVGSDATASEAREREVGRAIGAEYLLGPLLEAGSLVDRFQVTRRDTAFRGELHALSARASGALNDSHFLETFERIGGLSHPGILPIVDWGVRGVIKYFVSAPTPRESLRDRLRKSHGLPIADALSLARDIARPLAYAHERGVAHGDLRPKRIRLVGREPVITGFGILQAVAGAVDVARMSTVFAVGSPVYQSPEQLLDGAGAGPASDVYAFGSIVYELLTGELPFGDVTGVSLARRKLAGEPTPIRELRPTVPPAVEEVVTRCLARLAVDRYASLGAVLDALTETPTDTSPR